MPHIALVDAARQGDRQAFEALVRAHQSMALASARAWLGDDAAAADAAQEALLDAWRQLSQLSDSAAFSGWLKRIVQRRCQRQLRQRHPSQRVDEVPLPATHPSAEAHLSAEAERRAALRALDGLPEPQRLCVALHHLGGASLADIAAWLEVPVSTVKKRLFDARRRLATAALVPPAAPPPIGDAVALFLAVQAGDRLVVDRLVRAHPALLEAEAAWPDAEALAGGFDLAHDLTSLILAAGQGDLAMVDLLLHLGARPDGRCGCDNAETALWAAARAGHGAVVARLAAAGADTEAVNRAGWRPADLLRWRRDPPAAHPALPLAPIEPGAPLATGIAALDLWLPLRVGAVVRVHAAAETGLMVLLAEIAHALAAQGIRSVWTSWVARPWQRQAMADVARRYGLDAAVQQVSGPVGDPAVLPRALAALDAEPRPHCHVVFEAAEHTAQVEAALPDLGAHAALTLVVQPWAAVTAGQLAAPGHAPGLWQGVLVTDPRLAGQGLYPALHFARTRSAWSVGDAVAEDARSALAAYAEEERDLRASASAMALRARRVFAALTQPFHAAAPDTGWPGVWRSPAAVRAEVAALLAGEGAEVEERALRYRGAEALARLDPR